MKRTLRPVCLALLLCGGLGSLPRLAQAGPTTSDPIGIGLALPLNLVPFGVGLGLSGKYWLNSVHAIDGTLFGGSGWVSVAGDYLWHRYYVFSGDLAKRMPIYFGPGASITSWGSGPYSGTAVAVQGKLGVDYLFREPFDVYAEATPAINLTPSVGFSLGLSIGGRWYF
jgi:hypothetical protein